MSEDGAIIITGLEITRKQFPRLYKIAQKSPSMLAEQLRMFSQRGNPTQEDLWSAVVNFESDLEHDAKA